MVVIVLLLCVGRAYIKVPRVCHCHNCRCYEPVPDDGPPNDGNNDVPNDQRDEAM